MSRRAFLMVAVLIVIVCAILMTVIALNCLQFIVEWEHLRHRVHVLHQQTQQNDRDGSS